MRKRLFPALLAMLVVLSSFGLASAQQDKFAAMLDGKPHIVAYAKGGAPHWPKSVVTKGILRTSATPDGAYVTDSITASDRQLTAQIRRAIVRDKSLSTDAHNVKIIAQGGSVTLKGAVKSDAEKQAIESKAAQIAGEGKVNSELQVAPAK